MSTIAERICALFDDAEAQGAKVHFGAHMVGDDSGIPTGEVRFGDVAVSLDRGYRLPEAALQIKVAWGGVHGANPGSLHAFADDVKRAQSFAKRLGKLAFKANEAMHEARKAPKPKITFDAFGRKRTATVRLDGVPVGHIEREYRTALPGSIERGRFLYAYHAKVQLPYSSTLSDGAMFSDTFYADDSDAHAARTECRYYVKEAIRNALSARKARTA